MNPPSPPSAAFTRHNAMEQAAGVGPLEEVHTILVEFGYKAQLELMDGINERSQRGVNQHARLVVSSIRVQDPAHVPLVHDVPVWDRPPELQTATIRKQALLDLLKVSLLTNAMFVQSVAAERARLLQERQEELFFEKLESAFPSVRGCLMRSAELTVATLQNQHELEKLKQIKVGAIDTEGTEPPKIVSVSIKIDNDHIETYTFWLEKELSARLEEIRKALFHPEFKWYSWGGKEDDHFHSVVDLQGLYDEFRGTSQTGLVDAFNQVTDRQGGARLVKNREAIQFWAHSDHFLRPLLGGGDAVETFMVDIYALRVDPVLFKICEADTLAILRVKAFLDHVHNS